MTDKHWLTEILQKSPFDFLGDAFLLSPKDAHELVETVEGLEKFSKVTSKDKEFFFFRSRELERENQRYKQALEFYADKDNHKKPVIETSNATYLGSSPMEEDKGEKAQQVLKEGFHV